MKTLIGICFLLISGFVYGGTQAVIAPLRDTVLVVPAKPTTKDSLIINLFNASDCCGTLYRNKQVTVSGNTINLYYTYDDSLCQYVACIAAGSQTSFVSKPIGAGTYTIYKVGSMYCVGRVCPMIAIIPVKVGMVTVTASTGVNSIQTDNGRDNKTFSLNIRGNSMTLSMQHNSNVDIRVFDVRGALIGKMLKASMNAGLSIIRVDQIVDKQFANGSLVVHITVNGVTKTTMMVLPGK